MEETSREIAQGTVREAMKGSLFIGMTIQHGWTRLLGSMTWKKLVEKKCESNVNLLMITFGQARKRVLRCLGRMCLVCEVI